VKNPIVKLNTRRIRDWTTFHDVFAEVFGFPDFYGRNMNAWIDCMTSLDEPAAGMTSVHALPGGVLVLQLDFVDDFSARCPEIFDAIVEGAAFVNWRRTETSQEPVLAISFHKTPPR
jgi:hypothetical protein